MNYAQIRDMDISNGKGIGVALFVQGCHLHCYNCFNQETWDFNGGKKWTAEIENTFLHLIDRPYIKRVSILGGEPLADENIDTVLHIIKKIRMIYPDKQIWLYTGYTFEDISRNNDSKHFEKVSVLQNIDVLIDGSYIDSERDSNLKWVGSSNQRVIDVQQSLQTCKICLLI